MHRKCGSRGELLETECPAAPIGRFGDNTTTLPIASITAPIAQAARLCRHMPRHNCQFPPGFGTSPSGDIEPVELRGTPVVVAAGIVLYDVGIVL